MNRATRAAFGVNALPRRTVPLRSRRAATLLVCKHPNGHRINLSGLSAPQGTLVAGDFNAHDRTWLLTQSSDTRGQLLSEQLEVLNDPSSSTRRTFQADVHPSSPDISFCSPDLAIGARWEACLDLSLDHLPLVIDLHLSAPIQKKSSRTFFNFKKADRTSFSAQVEERLLDFDPTRYPSLDAAVGFFTRELLASSRNFIPVGFVRGNYPSVTHPFPGRLKVSCSNANISVLHLLRLLTSRGFTTSMRGLNPSLS